MLVDRERLGIIICLVLPLLFQACLDSSESPPARPDVPAADDFDANLVRPVDLVYICGNKFLATNRTLSTVHVTYKVVGTSETGGLTLREGTGGDPGFSETELETVRPGTVELYQDGERVARRPNEQLPCGTPAPRAALMTAGSEQALGRWSAPFSWPIIAVHLHLLRNGKVLSWGKFGSPQVWDPSTPNTFTPIPSADSLFCSGHAFLSDGRLLVSGGHITDHHGIADANLFNSGTMAWSPAASMARGRWYPTVTTLGNGQALALGGRDENGVHVGIPEVWTGSGWRALTSAGRVLPYYPRSFLAPNGRIFYAGENQKTLYLSTSGTGGWSSAGSRLYGTRDYGSAVMYQPGKILYVGGGHTTNSAEIIDLNEGTTWKWTGSMAYARRHLNATILPTGQVLVTGGTSGPGFSDESQAIHAAEMWDPATGNWTTLASNTVPRVYHSTSLLLKDGRVLHTGSGDAAGGVDHYDAEIYSPPYLFQGARPKISNAPSTVGYGQAFLVGTADPASIARVTWVRLGSVTHAFNMNQRFNELSFTQVTGGLNVIAPASRNLAPPGHYMLFILNLKGVPSTARVVRIR